MVFDDLTFRLAIAGVAVIVSAMAWSKIRDLKAENRLSYREWGDDGE